MQLLAILPALLSLLSLSSPALGSHHSKLHHRRHVASSNNSSATLVERGSGSFSGQATFFAVGLGACGGTNKDSDFIVALNQPQYEEGGWCYEMINVCYQGKCHSAQIVDECPGCARGSLDMSPALFNYFANPDLGVFQMTWTAGGGGGGSPKPTTSQYVPTSTYHPESTSTIYSTSYAPSTTSSSSVRPSSSSVSSSVVSSVSSSASATSSTVATPQSSGTTSSQDVQNAVNGVINNLNQIVIGMGSLAANAAVDWSN